MRRPTLTENKPNSKSFLRVNSEQVTSAGDESSISGTTNSAIRRFDEVLMTEIRSGPQMPLQTLLNVRSSADAETDDRSSGQNRLLIERTRDSVSRGRLRSTSPTVIPRSSRSVTFARRIHTVKMQVLSIAFYNICNARLGQTFPHCQVFLTESEGKALVNTLPKTCTILF